MEGYDSVSHNKRTPVIPVLLDCLFPVVSVNQQEVDRKLPPMNRDLTERFDPHCQGTRAPTHGSLRSAA
jgi:hypothetical protein